MIQDFQIREIDTVFADFVCKRETGDTDILRKAVTAASSSVGQGNICIDLADVFGCDGVDAASAALRASKSVGQPGDYCPLVLDAANRLYLYRYWKYEHDLARNLARTASELPEVDKSLLKDGLERLFGQRKAGPDWQRIAAAASVRSRFCVISGGPGTGKTTTVVKILALLLEQAKGGRMRIGLAAPTGKAAARLKESIHRAGNDLEGLTMVADKIPHDVSTIQRMLGVIPNSSRFRHNAANPLPFEAVVVDEASMVPLGLMAKLLDALAPGTRLLLLGDRDQLASVEAGAVLGDICNTGQSFGYSDAFRKYIADTAGFKLDESITDSGEVLLADSVVVLQKNYRFGEQSGIGMVSKALNEGCVSLVLDGIKAGNVADVAMFETPPIESLYRKLAGAFVDGFSGYLQSNSPDEVLTQFDRFRVICATRQGNYGVEGINKLIESALAEHGIIKPDKQWYHGRPVMITINDYSLKLYNGDIGIALNDPESEVGVSVYFPTTIGSARKLLPYRLPAHETVFAMTIHKSQGSEFERVLMIIPPYVSQILTREILYTGLTRARKSAQVYCTDDVFLAAADKRIQRRSGLRQALWG